LGDLDRYVLGRALHDSSANIRAYEKGSMTVFGAAAPNPS